ncbi:hypothetical protein ACIHCV_31940 [Streptomyces sp. NPDC051956]
MSAVPQSAVNGAVQHPPAVESAIKKIFKRVIPLFFIMFVVNYVTPPPHE